MAQLKQPEWHDFGPTFAAEQLARRHQIDVGKETLRKWMIEEGLWKSKPAEVNQVHLWRARRTGRQQIQQQRRLRSPCESPCSRDVHTHSMTQKLLI